MFYKTLLNFINFINKETLAQVFSCEFCEISKNTFSYILSTEKIYLEHFNMCIFCLTDSF